MLLDKYLTTQLSSSHSCAHWNVADKTWISLAILLTLYPIRSKSPRENVLSGAEVREDKKPTHFRLLSLSASILCALYSFFYLKHFSELWICFFQSFSSSLLTWIRKENLEFYLFLFSSSRLLTQWRSLTRTSQTFFLIISCRSGML